MRERESTRRIKGGCVGCFRISHKADDTFSLKYDHFYYRKQINPSFEKSTLYKRSILFSFEVFLKSGHGGTCL